MQNKWGVVYYPKLWAGPLDDLWGIIKHYAMQAGYEAGAGYRWQGPSFKSEAEYFTAEGYPLGTTCWFVILECNGRRKLIIGPELEESVVKAHQYLVDVVMKAKGQPNEHDDY